MSISSDLIRAVPFKIKQIKITSGFTTFSCIKFTFITIN